MCGTPYKMYAQHVTTTLSFRADQQLVSALEVEAARSGATRSELLVRAVRELLYRLACERDAEIYDQMPVRADERGSWSTEAWLEDEPGTDWTEVFGR